MPVRRAIIPSGYFWPGLSQFCGKLLGYLCAEGCHILRGFADLGGNPGGGSQLFRLWTAP
jgi:hypothetical protein